MNEDQKYMRQLHGKDISDIIDSVNKDDSLPKNCYYNKECEITTLSSMEIKGVQTIPLNICYRLLALKEAIKQDDDRRLSKLNYKKSPELIYAEIKERERIERCESEYGIKAGETSTLFSFGVNHD